MLADGVRAVSEAPSVADLLHVLDGCAGEESAHRYAQHLRDLAHIGMELRIGGRDGEDGHHAEPRDAHLDRGERAEGANPRRARIEADQAIASLRAGYDQLTARERDVFRLVSAGLLNKQIAAELGLAEITVKIHRGNLARKMGAGSVVDLVKMAQALGGLDGDSC